MKRIILLIGLMILVLFAFTGCKRKPGKLDLSNIIREVNWDMTKEDILKLEGEPNSEDNNYMDDLVWEYENKELGDYKGTLIFRFNAETGKLDFVKFIFVDSESYRYFMKDWKNERGDPDKTINKAETYEMWYGNIDGKYAVFSTNSKENMIEIDAE